MVNKREIDHFWDNCVDDIVLTDGLEEDEDKFDKGFWEVADLWKQQGGGATELHWTHFSRCSRYQTRELMNRMQLSSSVQMFRSGSNVQTVYGLWEWWFLSAMIMMCWSSRWKENFEKFLPEKVWGSSFPVWDLWGGRKLQEVDIEQNTSDLNHFWSKYVDISSILHSKLSTKISLKSMISIRWAESSRQKDIIELTFSKWRSWCQISWVEKLSKVILAPPTFSLSPLTDGG